MTRARLEARLSVDPGALLGDLRVAREWYERNVVGYRPDLWPGLVNRWDRVLNDAKSLAA